MSIYFIIIFSVGFKSNFNISLRCSPSVRNTAIKSR